MTHVRRSLAVGSLALVVAGCAGLPGAVQPVSQTLAARPVSAPVVRARICGRAGIALPAGWRLPSADEAGEAWRAADRERFLRTDLDLDGDGRPDQARVLMRIDGAGYGVFAFLCRDHGAPVPHLILHNRDLAYFRGVGIRPVEPGIYLTACGKGFIECYMGEPHEVRLAHAGIDYFRPESVTALFYWSETAQTFKWVALAK
jgi:hypothetical protein